MILKEEDVLLNITKDDKLYENLTINDTQELLKSFLTSVKKEMDYGSNVEVPGVSMYFANDEDKNNFQCKIYKTTEGNDRWIMFMKDDVEGYAIYQNPVTEEYEMAWYNSTIKDPLEEIDEKEMISCYVPIDY